jgi:hypothetical protein
MNKVFKVRKKLLELTAFAMNALSAFQENRWYI